MCISPSDSHLNTTYCHSQHVDCMPLCHCCHVKYLTSAAMCICMWDHAEMYLAMRPWLMWRHINTVNVDGGELNVAYASWCERGAAWYAQVVASVWPQNLFVCSTRIRTGVARFKVWSANHYTIPQYSGKQIASSSGKFDQNLALYSSCQPVHTTTCTHRSAEYVEIPHDWTLDKYNITIIM